MKNKLRLSSNTLTPDSRTTSILIGAGSFQRGFTSWILHEIQKQTGITKDIIFVKPTAIGDYSQLKNQHGRFHVALSGLHPNENKTSWDIQLIDQVRQIIHPYKEWEKFLKTAKDPNVQFIISNTTESGINRHGDQLVSLSQCPHSYPAKLACWLYQRFIHFEGANDRGCFILPLELIEYNGRMLKKLVMEISQEFFPGRAFLSWIDSSIYFYNTLVDRIVTGYPKENEYLFKAEINSSDPLLVCGEYFHQWIIAGPDLILKYLPFQKSNLNIRLVSEIDIYYKIKVRILNGMHTALVAMGLLLDYKHVDEVIADKDVLHFLSIFTREDVIPTIQYDGEYLNAYLNTTLDRFRNPQLKHSLEDISLNMSEKFMTRLYPTLEDHWNKHQKFPQRIVFLLACLLRLYKETPRKPAFELRDDAEKKVLIKDLWLRNPGDQYNFCKTVLGEVQIWGRDISTLPGIVIQTTDLLNEVEQKGVRSCIRQLL